jgi:hypothetical protein
MSPCKWRFLAETCKKVYVFCWFMTYINCVNFLCVWIIIVTVYWKNNIENVSVCTFSAYVIRYMSVGYSRKKVRNLLCFLFSVFRTDCWHTRTYNTLSIDMKKAMQLSSQCNNVRSIGKDWKENNFLVQHVIKFHADVKEKLDRILNVEKLA